jgi:GH25 family lysozyme M1 (1,4-beta-N-acetylmuramidase)
MSYPNGAATSILAGIDVSHYQRKIDWGAVAGSGVQFCFIKATEGGRDVDASFKGHWQGAATAGLIRGAYHFFRPQAPVSTQADLFAHTLGELQPGDLRPALDLEGTAGWADTPSADRAPLALNMLQAIECRLGVTPIVYTSPWFATEMLKSVPTLARFPIWIAQYTQELCPQRSKAVEHLELLATQPKRKCARDFWVRGLGSLPGFARRSQENGAGKYFCTAGRHINKVPATRAASACLSCCWLSL